MKRVSVMFLAMLLYILACFVIGILGGPARAHSWYPISCCSGYDCAPVLSAPQREGARLFVTTKHGSAWTDANTRIDQVPAAHDDGKVHACIRACPGATDKLCVICVFYPGAM